MIGHEVDDKLNVKMKDANELQIRESMAVRENNRQPIIDGAMTEIAIKDNDKLTIER